MAETKQGVKSALSADLWRVLEENEMARIGTAHEIMRDTLAGRHSPEIARPDHALAALALYGQPFGFTYEDVRLLRGVADAQEAGRTREGGPRKFGPMGSIPRLQELTDRIQALLPPEQP